MIPLLDVRARLLYNRLHAGMQFRLRNVMHGKFADRCRPATIAIMLTELCTAKCVHCDIWKNNTREDSPTADQWKRLLDDLRGWLGPVHVAFTGGEALMKPFTPELVAHASRIGLLAEVLTHGYWEDQTKMERLALARPWKVTVSLDGVGDTHTLIRGRVKFWERTSRSIETLQRMQRETGHPGTIRLKHVIMSHNLDETLRVADYGNRPGMEVVYQPIEQNYNTPDDTEWYLHSSNWVQDTERAVAIVGELIDRKKRGWRIGNSLAELEVMIPYFRDPAASRMAVQMHVAHDTRFTCNALTSLQIHANGDVRACTGLDPAGNIKHLPIRTIWESRPRSWLSGCCLERRLTEKERGNLISAAQLAGSATPGPR